MILNEIKTPAQINAPFAKAKAQHRVVKLTRGVSLIATCVSTSMALYQLISYESVMAFYGVIIGFTNTAALAVWTDRLADKKYALTPLNSCQCVTIMAHAKRIQEVQNELRRIYAVRDYMIGEEYEAIIKWVKWHDESQACINLRQFAADI